MALSVVYQLSWALLVGSVLAAGAFGPLERDAVARAVLTLAQRAAPAAGDDLDAPRALFLSYARADRATVDQLYDALVSACPDASVFQDHRIRPGERWLDAIRTSATTSSVMVCWVTPSYLDSLWAHYEIGAAQARGVRIVPVFHVAPEQCPPFVGEVQGVRVPPGTTADIIAACWG